MVTEAQEGDSAIKLRTHIDLRDSGCLNSFLENPKKYVGKLVDLDDERVAYVDNVLGGVAHVIMLGRELIPGKAFGVGVICQNKREFVRKGYLPVSDYLHGEVYGDIVDAIAELDAKLERPEVETGGVRV